MSAVRAEGEVVVARADVWESGEAYERYVGRWSRRVAAEFLDWLTLSPGLRVLDLGCGTGALMGEVLERCAPAAVVGLDPAEAFLAVARVRVPDARARFERGEAQALPFRDDAFDAAVSGLVLNFVPDAPRAVAELRRVVRPSGTVALYVWDYAGEMQFMRHFWDTAAALDEEAAALDEGRRFPICSPDALAGLLRSAGFDAVETRAITIPTVFADFDDFWSPFLGGQGPAPGYAMSLPEQARTALRDRLRESLPTEPNGRIALVARAWAIRGRVPPA